ncbi:MAG: hypothetical protein GX345_03975 [Clostridiales bacterium]|nr:hypothetical protein [Clostridiales bacterium]
MKRVLVFRVISLFLAITIIISLTGCGSHVPNTDPDEESSSVSQEETTSSEESPSEITTEPSTEATVPTEEVGEYGLTELQQNSFSMLYYLAITAEEIRTSKDNRLLLNDIYTSLLNDINPSSIDEITQDHLRNLRDIIKSFLNISVKRERLQYIYNQNKATTIRNAVPDPLAILSVASSLDWKKLAITVAYTLVDSYNNYKSTNEAVDQEFLISGWELDDEETAAVYKNRERAFDYMIDIVREYDLDGKLTLNEKSIETFAGIRSIESVQEKIHRLESEEETYKLLGNYWLELADCYFQKSQYDKCLDCIGKYNELATGIYRKDYNYVQILPKAIVAAQETYSGSDYISKTNAFADAIIKNTATDEWSVRYFAAQVYLDLYAKTDKREYLETAYSIASDNVTILLKEQRSLNATYLSELKEITVDEPDYRFMTKKEKKEEEKKYKDEKKRLKSYNKALKKARKSELPPLYEPLALNCDLLFALADEMNISDLEKVNIEEILQIDTNGVFMSEPINNRYSFSTSDDKYSVDFKKNKVIIPAILLTTESEIIIEVTEDGKVTTFDDCIVTKVEREDDSIESFYATVTSKKMKKNGWSENSKVTIKITNGDDSDVLTSRFKVAKYRNNWIFPDKVEFEEE